MEKSGLGEEIDRIMENVRIKSVKQILNQMVKDREIWYRLTTPQSQNCPSSPAAVSRPNHAESAHPDSGESQPQEARTADEPTTEVPPHTRT